MDTTTARVIIVEGAQGVGKTTVTNILREKILYCNLYRLTGIKDKTLNGREKIYNHYLSLLEYLQREATTEATHLFDRTFTTEYVYSLLDHAHYDFTKQFEDLISSMEELSLKIPVYYFTLTMDATKFEQTLSVKISKPQHAGIVFSSQESLVQQEKFLTIPKYMSCINHSVIDASNISAEDVANRIIDFITTVEGGN